MQNHQSGSQLSKLEDFAKLDETDAAHPAYWRGQDSGVNEVVTRIQDIFNGKSYLLQRGRVGDRNLHTILSDVEILKAKVDLYEKLASAECLTEVANRLSIIGLPWMTSPF